jgi:multiple sugar transport system permease protein
MTTAEVVAQRPGDPAEPPPEKARRDTGTALLMVAPAVILLLLFVVVPFILAGWLSLNNVKLSTGRPPSFMGLEQYRRLFFEADIAGEFFRGLLNNFVFALIVVPLQTCLALGLAILVNRPLRGMTIFRTIFFMPVVFPMALVATIWQLIYSRDELGLLNSLLSAVSFGAIKPVDWLGDPNIALFSIIVLSVWAGVGFQMVILLAGLQGIPPSLYEAAALDRAGRWQKFLNVTVPGLRNTLIFVVLVTTIFSLRLFDQVFILTQGGPQNATTTIMYQAVSLAFRQDNIGRAAAITVVFTLIVIVITVIQRRILREEREIA